MQTSVKIEAVTAVEMFVSVVAVAAADGDGNGGRNRVTTKELCNKEGGGDGGKSDREEGGGQATATVTTWVLINSEQSQRYVLSCV